MLAKFLKVIAAFRSWCVCRRSCGLILMHSDAFRSLYQRAITPIKHLALLLLRQRSSHWATGRICRWRRCLTRLVARMGSESLLLGATCAVAISARLFRARNVPWVTKCKSLVATGSPGADISNDGNHRPNGEE